MQMRMYFLSLTKRRLNYLALIFLFGTAGCMDADPFNRNKKEVIGDYYLKYFSQNNQFYLHKKNETSSVGVLEGVVRLIGWNENTILAKVEKCYRGDPDGWYTIDVKSGIVEGPFDSQCISENNDLSQIACSVPEKASISGTSVKSGPGGDRKGEN